MLYTKSKPEEIIYHIQQLEAILLTQDESNYITKILALENIISDDMIKFLIAEDLKDENWINETKILILTCNKKISKNNLVNENILHSKNFLTYRMIEQQCLSHGGINITRSLNNWSFNIIEKTGSQLVWGSSKFLRYFKESSFPTLISNMLDENQQINIYLTDLHKNRELFYNEIIFTDLNIQMRKFQANQLVSSR